MWTRIVAPEGRVPVCNESRHEWIIDMHMGTNGITMVIKHTICKGREGGKWMAGYSTDDGCGV